MKYEIVNLQKKVVKGILKETSSINGQCIKDISYVWEKFCGDDIYANIKFKINDKAIGLYREYEGDFTKPYKFMACCEVSQSSENKFNLVEKIIPAGKYAKFIINGDVKKSVGEFWSKLWDMNLNRAYTCDFEEYQNNTQDMNNQEIHIYIALK